MTIDSPHDALRAQVEELWDEVEEKGAKLDFVDKEL